MLSDITKVLDRNFIVGFFLPSVILSFLSLWVLSAFNLLDPLAQTLKFLPVASQELNGGKYQLLFLTILSFVNALILMLMNQFLYHVCEGYIGFDRLSVMKFFELKRMKKLQRNSDMEAQQRFSSEFPPENFVLPTAFGNAIRSFETYPNEVYGVESIVVWYRLLAVLPSDYRDTVNLQKSSVDFWLNLWIGSLILSFLYFFLHMYSGASPSLMFPLAFGALAFFAAKAAKESALNWGEYVKTSFDVYLPELQKKLGFSVSFTRKQERDLWKAISQTFLYRHPISTTTSRSWWDQVADLVRNQAVEDETILRYKDGSGEDGDTSSVGSR